MAELQSTLHQIYKKSSNDYTFESLNRLKGASETNFCSEAI